MLKIIFAVAALTATARAEKPITLAVDLTEAPRRLYHVRETVPATGGTLALSYPKWIPGEHGPTGPVVNVAALRFTAAGKPLPWKRDPVDMYQFRVEVPAGASAIEAAFDYLLPVAAEGFSSAASTSSSLAVLEWNVVVLYPSGRAAREVTVAPSLKLPPGWKLGTALETARSTGASTEFKPVTLETLVDSPVIAGAHFRAVPLDAAHELDLAGDTAESIEAKPETVAAWKQLVAEAGVLFGAHHYERYHFLLALSDAIGHFGLEHHQSSDNRSWERTLTDDDARMLSSTLLPHEFTHSWNGKHRRPAGLATPDFQQPMHGALLWVYEGLTNYLGWVLAARSGLLAPDAAQDELAAIAAGLDHRAGRQWRPLGDTAVAAQILYRAPPEWTSLRRSTDFYPEGTLLWLEADVAIRQKSKGARSLDDFCKKFHGGTSGGPSVSPYSLDDVIAALEAVEPNDWRGFFQKRIDAVAPHPPLDGITLGGWKLVYNDTPNKIRAAAEKLDKVLLFGTSLGTALREDGTFLDVTPGMPAAQAGIAPGMKLLGVNGRKWSPPLLHDAIKAATSTGAIELLVENAEFFQTAKLKYKGGEQRPHLERVASRPDLVGEILKPHATAKLSER